MSSKTEANTTILDSVTDSALPTDGATALRPDEEGITREQRRSRRKREIRARTISVKRMTKRELEIGRLLYPENGYWRPRTRAECAGERDPARLFLVNITYSWMFPRARGRSNSNFPDLDVWDMNESCALDVADRGGTTLEDVGAIMNLTRERIRQVEVKALAKLEALRDMLALRDYIDEGPVGKRRLPKLTPTDVALDVDDDEDDEDDIDLKVEPTTPNVDFEPEPFDS